jgi:hypothetical protein
MGRQCYATIERVVDHIVADYQIVARQARIVAEQDTTGVVL